MTKLENMHIVDIIDKTNLYLKPRDLYDIWKKPEEMPNISRESLGKTALVNDRQLAKRLAEDDVELYTFLNMHEEEIDKLLFITTLLFNYRERLGMSDQVQIDSEEAELIQQGVKGIRELMKGIDKTFIHYNMSNDRNRIENLVIIRTKEVANGTDRKEKNSNSRRLQKIKEDTELAEILEGIIPLDIEYSITYDKKVGEDMRRMVEYNTIVREYGDKLEILKKEKMSDILGKTDRLKFVEEIVIAIEKHIEEINIDRLLLCSAYRYIEGIEQGNIEKNFAEALKERLELIKKHIEKNSKVIMYPDKPYTIKQLEQDLARFVGKEGNITYLSKKDVKELKDALLAGEITLNSIGRQNIKAMALDVPTMVKVLQGNPDNYIFFLRGEKCPYTKATILKDIKNSSKCSTDLLKLLCEKTNITSQEVRDLFDNDIITASDLKTVRDLVDTVITDEILFKKYKKYKTSNNQEDERIQLERYALAYRNTEVLGKTPEEIQSKAEEFITGVGEELEPSDLVQLYGFDIIPLKVAVDWGGEDIIEELLQNGRLKPMDAKQLRNEGLLNEQVLERVFKKCNQMVYSDQVSLVSAVFDGQTPEEQEIRERLAQYYNIESGMINFKTKANTGRRKSNREQTEEPKSKIKMRDPGAKYNLLVSIDKDVTIETGIRDGHIIFHYPNVDDATVLIEKLHKISTNRETGQIEIKADNEAATYVLSEEEFIKMKSLLIQNGKIDRTQLTQRWWKTRDPEHWIPHNGMDYWEKNIMERFEINEENSRYSAEDLKKIQELKAKSVESKKMQDR